VCRPIWARSGTGRAPGLGSEGALTDQGRREGVLGTVEHTVQPVARALDDVPAVDRDGGA
jgi:hypothetical protein